MISSCRRAIRATALLLVFSLLHVYAGASLAAIMPQGQVMTGELITRDNKPVLVNGIQTKSGMTILPGANLETGDQVSATINLGPLGSLEISPNTKVLLDFSEDQIKVKLIQGCLVLRVKEKNYGEIYTDKGKLTSNDPNLKQAAVLDVCNPPGATAPVINRKVLGTVIGGGIVATLLGLVLGSRGENPSP